MLNSLKRKNDDKPKGRKNDYGHTSPHLRNTIVFTVLIGLVLIGIVLRKSYEASTNQPKGHIYYTRDDIPTVLDLQTGDRTSYEPSTDPLFNLHPPYEWGTSPDGQWHIEGFRSAGSDTWDYLILTNTKTQIAHSIGPVYGYNSGALWSPDSQSIIFVALPEPFTNETFSEEKIELWRIDVPTQQLIRLTNNAYVDYGAKISPDSTKLAYIAVPDGHITLHIMDLKTGQTIIPAPEMAIFLGRWSPDSQWIVFETNPDDLWIIRADGSDQQGIATDPQAKEGNPTWKP